MSSPNNSPFGHDSADPDSPMPAGKRRLACPPVLSTSTFACFLLLRTESDPESALRRPSPYSLAAFWPPVIARDAHLPPSRRPSGPPYHHACTQHQPWRPLKGMLP